MAAAVTTPQISPGIAGIIWSRCSHVINATIRDIKYLYLVLRHPDTPWYARVVLFFPVAYICSPIQLIPSFIPVIGQLDDLFAIWIAKRLMEHLVSEDIRGECGEAVGRPKFSPANDKSLTQTAVDED
jgi:uncharacterized membrane protein YkvA (DUF1232 family)